jgi:hypothetical protein
LKDDMTKYKCCQGYFDCCCFKAGSMGESSCPELCLCCESVCCPSCVVSASRLVVMDEYDLASDPCDNRIIRIYNCLVLISCLCDLAAIISGNDTLKQIANIIDIIVHIMFQCISGCMTAQTAYEVDYRANKQTGINETLK